MKSAHTLSQLSSVEMFSRNCFHVWFRETRNAQAQLNFQRRERVEWISALGRNGWCWFSVSQPGDVEELVLEAWGNVPANRD